MVLGHYFTYFGGQGRTYRTYPSEGYDLRGYGPGPLDGKTSNLYDHTNHKDGAIDHILLYIPSRSFERVNYPTSPPEDGQALLAAVDVSAETEEGCDRILASCTKFMLGAGH